MSQATGAARDGRARTPCSAKWAPAFTDVAGAAETGRLHLIRALCAVSTPPIARPRPQDVLQGRRARTPCGELGGQRPSSSWPAWPACRWGAQQCKDGAAGREGAGPAARHWGLRPGLRRRLPGFLGRERRQRRPADTAAGAAAAAPLVQLRRARSPARSCRQRTASLQAAARHSFTPCPSSSRLPSTGRPAAGVGHRDCGAAGHRHGALQRRRRPKRHPGDAQGAAAGGRRGDEGGAPHAHLPACLRVDGAGGGR